MKIRDIITGIVLIGFAASSWNLLNTYYNEVDNASALQLKIDLRDQQIAGMRNDLESIYSELEGERFGASEFGTERSNQVIIHNELGGEMERVLEDGTRVDLVFQDENSRGPSMRACEIDWATKWAEGVGQAIYYTVKLNEPIINGATQSGGPLNVDNVKKLHMPVVILLAKGADSGWEKYRDRAEFCERVVSGIRVWVFDAETKTWLDRD
jgi:hypothetical protein